MQGKPITVTNYKNPKDEMIILKKIKVINYGLF